MAFCLEVAWGQSGKQLCVWHSSALHQSISNRELSSWSSLEHTLAVGRWFPISVLSWADTDICSRFPLCYVPLICTSDFCVREGWSMAPFGKHWLPGTRKPTQPHQGKRHATAVGCLPAQPHLIPSTTKWNPKPCQGWVLENKARCKPFTPLKVA